MKQTFLPIAVLLSVTLTLVGFLYHTDTNNTCRAAGTQAKRVRTGIIYSSLPSTNAATPVITAAIELVAIVAGFPGNCPKGHSS